MAESKVKNENFIAVQGWMLKDLKLKGNELIIYACIYGFSQADNQVFNGSLQYLADWTNSTKQGVLRCLKSLTEKGFIVKTEKIINGVKFCEYYTTDLNTVLNKVEYPIEESLTNGIKQSLPNNIGFNNLPNNKTKKIDYEHIKDMYNEICISLPRLTVLSDKRKQAIKARLNKYSLDQIKQVFINAEASDFLKGGNNRNWQANFDWLMKDANFAKVLDGNYANKESKKGQSYAGYSLDLFEEMLNKDDEPKTAADDESIRARAEALKQQFTKGAK